MYDVNTAICIFAKYQKERKNVKKKKTQKNSILEKSATSHLEIQAVSQTEDCILRRSHLQAAYLINPGLFQLTEHYIRES